MPMHNKTKRRMTYKKLKKTVGGVRKDVKKTYKALKPTLKKIRKTGINVRNNINYYFDENQRQMAQLARRWG